MVVEDDEGKVLFAEEAESPADGISPLDSLEKLPKSPDSHGRKLIYALLTLIAIAGLGLAIFFFSNREQKSTQPQASPQDFIEEQASATLAQSPSDLSFAPQPLEPSSSLLSPPTPSPQGGDNINLQTKVSPQGVAGVWDFAPYPEPYRPPVDSVGHVNSADQSSLSDKVPLIDDPERIVTVESPGVWAALTGDEISTLSEPEPEERQELISDTSVIEADSAEKQTLEATESNSSEVQSPSDSPEAQSADQVDKAQKDNKNETDQAAAEPNEPLSPSSSSETALSRPSEAVKERDTKKDNKNKSQTGVSQKGSLETTIKVNEKTPSQSTALAAKNTPTPSSPDAPLKVDSAEKKISPFWAANLFSSTDQAEAESVWGRLKDKAGDNRLYRYQTNLSGQNHYRIRLGFFEQKEQAQKAALEIAQKVRLSQPWLVQPTMEEVNRFSEKVLSNYWAVNLSSTSDAAESDSIWEALNDAAATSAIKKLESEKAASFNSLSLYRYETQIEGRKLIRVRLGFFETKEIALEAGKRLTEAANLSQTRVGQPWAVRPSKGEESAQRK
ncbi:MAG: SPOR domain-containing protein [Deltaproteobacteria bacterium]|jgi:hypothetical protein|nr:SPOR domain-containing protein [Deltaproteobacteria bacterium]